jgi:hypothetical protein
MKIDVSFMKDRCCPFITDVYKKNWKLKGHNSDGHVDTSNINFIENKIGGAYH